MVECPGKPHLAEATYPTTQSCLRTHPCLRVWLEFQISPLVTPVEAFERHSLRPQDFPFPLKKMKWNSRSETHRTEFLWSMCSCSFYFLSLPDVKSVEAGAYWACKGHFQPGFSFCPSSLPKHITHICSSNQSSFIHLQSWRTHRIFRMWGVVRTILYPIMIKECHTELFLYSHCYNSLATSLTSLLSFLVFPGSSPHGSELFLEPCQAPHLPTQNLWCLPIALGVKSKQPAMSYKAKHNQPQVLLRSHFPP